MKNNARAARLSIVIFCCLLARPCLLSAAAFVAPRLSRSTRVTPFSGAAWNAGRVAAQPWSRALGLSAAFTPTLTPLLQVAPAAPKIVAAPEPALASLGQFELSAARFGGDGALGALFDGSRRLSGGGAGTTPRQDEVESFARYATGLFYPNGGPANVFIPRTSKPAGEIPGEDEMRAKMELSPLTNPEREEAVQALFARAGAKPGEVVKQPAGRGRNNYYVVKKGRTDRVVVVGAHHDKVSEGRGTIDNWTGTTMMINLYQALRDVETEATYVFIAFAREEEGLIGSAAYVRSLSDEQRGKIDAMVNLDTLAVDGTFSWKNNSDKVLLDLIRKVADQEKRDLVEARLDGGDADSSTFRDAGIPAMTVFGASQDVIFDIIHSERDNMSAFSMPHYKNAYLLTLALLKALSLGPVSAAAGA